MIIQIRLEQNKNYGCCICYEMKIYNLYPKNPYVIGIYLSTYEGVEWWPTIEINVTLTGTYNALSSSTSPTYSPFFHRFLYIDLIFSFSCHTSKRENKKRVRKEDGCLLKFWSTIYAKMLNLLSVLSDAEKVDDSLKELGQIKQR